MQLYTQIALAEGALGPSVLRRLRSLGKSTLLQMLKLRHPLHFSKHLSLASKKDDIITELASPRWFPNDEEMQ